jgi:hypothetical protein
VPDLTRGINFRLGTTIATSSLEPHEIIT